MKRAPETPSEKEIGVIERRLDPAGRDAIDACLLFLTQSAPRKEREEFLAELAAYLGKVLGVEHVFIGGLLPGGSTVRIVGAFSAGHEPRAEEYHLENTPCQRVASGEFCIYPRDVQGLFPLDRALVDLAVQSYAAVPLLASSGKALGLVSIMDTKPLETPDVVEKLLRIVAPRAAVELEKMCVRDELLETNFLLNEAQRLSECGVYSLDLLTMKWKSTAVLDEIFGIDEHFPRDVEGWLSIVHPDDRQMMAGHFGAVIARRESFDREYRIIRPESQDERWVHGRGELRVSNSGDPARMIGVIRDITASKHAEEARREVESMRDRLRLSMNRMPIPYILWGVDRIVSDWNPAAETVFGYTREEAVGRSLLELVIPEPRRAAVAKIMDALVVGEDASHSEAVSALREDGSTVFCRWFNTPLFAETGEAVGVLSMAMDVSAAEESRVALAQSAAIIEASEERYRSLIDDASSGIYRSTIEGQFLHVNPALVKMLGYDSAAELLAVPVPDLYVEPEQRATVVRRGLESLAQGPSLDLAWKRKDGRQIDVHLTGSVVRGHESVPDTFQMIVEDITELRHSRQLAKLQAAGLNATANAIVFTDPKGNVVWVNAAFTALTGYEREEVVGGNLRLLKSSVQSNDFYDELWGTIKGGRVWSGEIVNRKKDGSLYTEDMTITPLMNEAGEVTHYIAIKQDVSHRARALQAEREARLAAEATERALADSEAEYRELVEHAAYAIYRSAPTGEILSANTRMAEMLGYDSVDEVLRLDMARSVYANPEGRQEVIRSLGSQDRFDDVEAHWTRRDGEVITVRLRGRAVSAEDGSVVAWETMADDITQTRKLEAQLRQAQKMEAVGQLTGGIAHDFNNELSVIQLNAELMTCDLDDGGSVDAKDLAAIRAAAKRAARMTQQLLSVSRQAELNMVPTDLVAVARGLMGVLRTMIPESIDVRLDEPDPVGPVRVDPGSVEQMLLNLASNARDAMSDGGVMSLRVFGTTFDEEGGALPKGAPSGSYVCLEVSDNGSGMDEQIRAKIFDPFFTTKAQGKGSGLGLAMVYGLAVQQGGFATVYSEVGTGTTVRLSFPEWLGDSEIEGVATVESRAIGGSETILVVEDEHAVREVARKALERSGYRVFTATDGAQGLEMFREHKDEIHLILSDLVMPNMGGRKLLEHLREEGHDVRLILSSGYAGRDAEDRALLDSVVPFLQKPWELPALLRTVRRVLDTPHPGSTKEKV